MKLHSLRWTAAALALVGAAWLSSSAPVTVGEKAEFSFREAPFNARGVAGMGDLRGKPILIDFWGKN